MLLLEAGGPPRNRFISIPAGMTKLFKSEVDWALESEPQTAIGGRRIFTPRGRMLGGSSNMNAQMHQNPIANYDNNQHAPNENVTLGSLRYGISTFTVALGSLAFKR